MAQKAEVEIIPCIHDFLSRFHEETVEYVKKLPKNSWVAIESTPALMRYDYIVTDLVRGKEPSKIHGSTEEQRAIEFHKTKGLPSLKYGFMTLAGIELLHECEKRNIKLIPIEPPIPKKRSDKTRSMPLDTPLQRNQYIKKAANADIQREVAFARQIQTILNNFNGKLVMLTGAEHAPHMPRLLQAKGIKTNINTNIFSERKRMDTALKIIKLSRNDAKAGNFDAYTEKRNPLTQLIFDLKRRGDPSQIRRKLFAEIRKRDRIAKERAKRRHAEKKRKRTILQTKKRPK